MSTQNAIRFLRIKELIAMIGIGKSSIYDRLDTHSPRHDPDFPKPIKLGVSTTVWVSNEVIAWMNKQIMIARQQ